jgi:hypothetical protein
MTPDGSAQTIPISLGKASMPAPAAALASLVVSAIQLGAVLRRACRWVFIRMKAINCDPVRSKGGDAAILNMLLAACRLQFLQGRCKKIARGGSHMATLIVLDHSGDTRHYFDARDKKALRDAEFRFKALTGAGYTAAARNAEGEATVIRSFNPNAEETLFFPRLVGG